MTYLQFIHIGTFLFFIKFDDFVNNFSTEIFSFVEKLYNCLNVV